MNTKDTIAVLDFGGQYAHLITNRIRRLGVHAIIKPYNSPTAKLKEFAGLILSGGPQSVNAKKPLLADPKIFELGIPVLGICYGHQVIAHQLQGQVSPGKTKEYSKTKLYVDKQVGLFDGVGKPTTNNQQPVNQVWMSHWDEVTEIPVDFEVLAHTDNNEFAAVGNLKKNIYGLQFHPEVTHTEQGMKILGNFVNLTEAEKTWSTANYLENIKQEILQQVSGSQAGVGLPLSRGSGGLGSGSGKSRKVFMLVSGGVDSVVAFTLLNKVLGKERVYGMLVDTGFMRKDEIEEVREALHKQELDNLHIYDAKEEFYKELEGEWKPEAKRKTIGKLFVKIQARAIEELGLDTDHWLLGQGTIYPDTIESGATKHADKIKTHHNRVPEIQAMIDQGLVIEPLADLYKDEVRELGEELGLPHHLVWRHPFPGPGLAIRILCTPPSSNGDAARIDNRSTGNGRTTKTEKRYEPRNRNPFHQDEEKINIFLKQHNLEGTVLPLRSVGVQGDARTYRHPLLLTPTNNKSWSDFWNHEELQNLSTELTNKFDSINRVLFSLHPNPSPSFSILPNQLLTPDRVEFLQDADKIVMDEINSFDLEEKMIWQCPTVLLPISINQKPETSHQQESLVIRPISSIDAMTADFALIPKKNLENILKKLENLKPSAIFYDLTNKPPGTIEWE